MKLKSDIRDFLLFTLVIITSVGNLFCEDKEFIIYQGKKEIGSERFTIKKENEEIIIESTAKMDLPVMNLKFNQNCVLKYNEKDFSFKSYENKFSAGPQMGMTKALREENKIKCNILSGGLPLSKNLDYKDKTLFIDNNYFSHFYFIANLIDLSKQEEVNLNVFSPSAMSYFPAIIKPKKGVTLKKDGEEIKLKNNMLLMPLNNLSIYMNEKNEIVCIVDNTNGFKAILNDYKDYKLIDEKIEIKIPENVKEEEVEFKSGDLKLSGSLTKPVTQKGKIPGFILISGSGPQDRNENFVLSAEQTKQYSFLEWSGPDWNIFNTIAYKISSEGFAVLRYDDRGVGKSEGNFSEAKLSDFVNDVKSAVKFLQSREGIDSSKIILIGHSEGAMIAPIVASEGENIYAIILMAVPAETLDKVILRQTEDTLKESGLNEMLIKIQVNRIASNLKKIIESTEDWIELDGQKVFTGWLREHSKYNVLETLCNVKCPIVIFQGKKDKQVYPDYAEKIEKTFKEKEKKNLRVKYFDDLDHLFMKSSGWISEYYDKDRKLSEEFLESLLVEVKKVLVK